jgi:c-di-GMP-binding flagellar brake protein YcgR
MYSDWEAGSMKVDEQQLLRDAVARNAGFVLSLPTGNVVVHHKSRFVAADDEGFWVQIPDGTRGLIDRLMANRQTVGLSLIASSFKVVFTSLIMQFRAEMPLNSQITINAILLAWPAQLAAIQRRASYRASIRLDADLAVHAWCISEEAGLPDPPAADTQIHVIPRNLSIDGMGLICLTDPQPPPFALDQRLRIEIAHADCRLLLGGRVRHLRKLPNGNTSVGVQFAKLDLCPANRSTLAGLTNLVGQLQRDEIRRHRFVEAIGRAG